MTFAEEIENAAAGKEIIGIVFSAERGGYDYFNNDPSLLHKWEDVRETLNYTYDASYGSADCHAIYAWTEDRVIFVHEYDGSTSVQYVPRNPTAVRVEFDGIYPED